MVGLNETRQARYGADRFDEMRSLGNDVGGIVVELGRYRKQPRRRPLP